MIVYFYSFEDDDETVKSDLINFTAPDKNVEKTEVITVLNISEDPNKDIDTEGLSLLFLLVLIDMIYFQMIIPKIIKDKKTFHQHQTRTFIVQKNQNLQENQQQNWTK
jgi:hypothetical protein